jgi:adenine-specific DNA-methyltransferase
MSLVEDLIAQISDPSLRDRLASEVRGIKRQLSWGLTFERHAPEIGWLRNAPIQVGTKVIDRRTVAPWQVTAIDGENLRVEAEGVSRTVQRIEVLVEKRFDEPVYPALTSLGSVRCGPPLRSSHGVIEADNYQALELLAFVLAGQVDCIYIDPPYNTLDDDWKYNNKFIDSNDAGRHSKWLSMMERRLKLAKVTLKDDGIVVVAIDKNEHAYLVMLLEQLFPGYDITSVAVVHNPRGVQGDNFSYTHEFAVFVIPGKGAIAKRPLLEGLSDDKAYPSESEEGEEMAMPAAGDGQGSADDGELPKSESSPFRNWGGESLRSDAKNCFYPVLVRDDLVVGFGEVPADDFHPTGVNVPRKDGTTEVWPIDPKGVEHKWRYARQSVGDIKQQLLVRHIRDRLDIDIAKDTAAFRTVWRNPRYDASTHGSQLIGKFIGEPFPYPKSLYTMRDVLYVATANKPDALILDFFAGSATTLHATMLLNAEGYPDAEGRQEVGRRRCLLVTNNEVGKKAGKRLNDEGYFEGDPEFERHGIFEAVARPRVTAAITGTRPDGAPVKGRYLDGRPFADGLAENAEFFRLDFLDPIDIRLGLRFAALHPALWLMAGGIGEREEIDTTAPYALPDQSPYAVVFDASGVGELIERLKGRPDVSRVFVVTESDDTYAAVAERLPKTIKTTKLYGDYLEAMRRPEGSAR